MSRANRKQAVRFPNGFTFQFALGKRAHKVVFVQQPVAHHAEVELPLRYLRNGFKRACFLHVYIQLTLRVQRGYKPRHRLCDIAHTRHGNAKALPALHARQVQCLHLFKLRKDAFCIHQKFRALFRWHHTL